MKPALTTLLIACVFLTGCASYTKHALADETTTLKGRTFSPPPDKAWVYFIKDGGPLAAGAEVETPDGIRTMLNLDMVSFSELPPGRSTFNVYRIDGYSIGFNPNSSISDSDREWYYSKVRPINTLLSEKQYYLIGGKEYVSKHFVTIWHVEEARKLYDSFFYAANVRMNEQVDSGKDQLDLPFQLRRTTWLGGIANRSGDDIDRMAPASTLEKHLEGGKVYFAVIHMTRGGQIPEAKWVSDETGKALAGKFPFSQFKVIYDNRAGYPRPIRVLFK